MFIVDLLFALIVVVPMPAPNPDILGRFYFISTTLACRL